MDIKRRRLIQAGLAGGAAAASGGLPAALGQQRETKSTAPRLNILILGGTGFIGPHMVRELLRRGHTVSLFNRGRTNKGLFPDLELLVGDRNNGLQALEGRKWDAVIDNSGYVPRHVRDSARLLSPAISHYVFVSSISAYESFAIANDEQSPLATMPDETVEEVTGETYGPMKALCERSATEEMGADRVTVLRPTYVCGPGDHTDRYTYWPVRTMRGGEMLWPGEPAQKIQIIDVRDLANFAVNCVEQKILGNYNMVTPAGSISMGQLMEDCVAVTAAGMSPVWVNSTFIEKHDAAEGRAIPIWAPPDGEYGKVALVSGERAAAKGLVTRPNRETARDTVAWWKTLPPERTASLKAGLSAEREQELLAMWKEES